MNDCLKNENSSDFFMRFVLFNHHISLGKIWDDGFLCPRGPVSIILPQSTPSPLGFIATAFALELTGLIPFIVFLFFAYQFLSLQNLSTKTHDAHRHLFCRFINSFQNWTRVNLDLEFYRLPFLLPFLMINGFFG